MALDMVAAPSAPGDDAAAALLAALDGPALLLDGDRTVGMMTGAAARLLALDPAAPRHGAPLATMLARTGLAQDARDALACLAQLSAPASCQLRDPAGGAVTVARVPLPGRRLALLFQPVTAPPDPADPPLHADALTGLADRSSFRAALAARLASGPDPLGLLVLDIDRFWVVNDTLGPQVGDQLLATVAARLRGAVRGTDLPARLDGDEFAVLVAEAANPQELEGLARRLMDGLSRPYLLNGQPVTIGFSVGIARAPTDGTDADSLLRCANLALHAVKSAGKGRCASFTPAMQLRSESRRLLENDLRRTFALRQFTLHYQPQVDLLTNRLFGFEALLRWHHRVRGAVSPAEFVPLAEEIGLIPQIGAWVLATACKEAAGWPGSLSVAVNVSALQFEQGDLLAAVDEALERSGLAPQRLEIEVTESALLGNAEATLAVLRRLRSNGVQIAMDDFGTGYSSLTRLQSFPFDKIKIDRSFVSGARGIAEGRAIVRAITGLGASLGMRTIAEGVETQDQLDRVRAEGCTEVQGYLFGRPMPPADLPAAIARFAAGIGRRGTTAG